MNALILAAGRGTRISRYLEGNPKCTVDIGGKPLIKYTVELLRSKGIKKICLVVGYQHQVIENVLKSEDIEFYYNPFFDVTNSIGSAWFARDYLNNNEDLLVMNADVFVEPSVIDILLEEKRSPVLLGDDRRKEEADYKLKYTNGILEKYGKELKGDDITGEYVGIAKMSKDYIPTFKTQLEKMIGEQKHSVWWENVLYELSEKQNIHVLNVGNRFWAEVDYIEDYERIQAFVKNS